MKNLIHIICVTDEKPSKKDKKSKKTKVVVESDDEEEEDKPKEKATKSKKKVSETVRLKNHYLKIIVGPRNRYFNFQHEM